jgi:hypothetical protein
MHRVRRRLPAGGRATVSMVNMAGTVLATGEGTAEDMAVAATGIITHFSAGCSAEARRDTEEHSPRATEWAR